MAIPPLSFHKDFLTLPKESRPNTENSDSTQDHVEVEKDYIPETVRDGDGADTDIVEVVGEPVSRCEADALEAEHTAAVLKHVTSRPGVAPEQPQGRRTERIPVPDKQEKQEAPHDPTIAKLLRSEEMLTSGNLEAALVLAQEAAKDQRTAKQARLIIARAFMEQGEDAKALSVLQAIPKTDESAEALYYRGLTAARLNRTDEAVKYLEKALTLPESDASRRAGCQALYDRINQAKDAKDTETTRAIGGLTGARPKPLARAKRRYRSKVATKLTIAIVAIIFLPILFLIALWLFSPENYTTLINSLIGRIG